MIDLQCANHALAELALAHQEGRLGLHEYRQRRRSLLAQVRDQAAVTHRNAAQAGAGRAPAAPPADSLALLAPARSRLLRPLLLLAGVLVMVVLASLLLGGYFNV